MNQTIKFWDKTAEKYSKKPIANEAVYQEKLQITRNYLTPEMKVLEFGCGTGSTAIIHAPFVKHIHAVDISSKMIEIANKKAVEKNIRNLTFEVTCIEDLVSDQTFDVVLGLNIMHLVENKEDIIKKTYSLLKPGGMFITSTVCLGDSMKFFKLIAPVGKFFGFMPTLRVFTIKEFETSITTAGFTIERLWQPEKSGDVFIVAQKGG